MTALTRYSSRNKEAAVGDADTSDDPSSVRPLMRIGRVGSSKFGVLGILIDKGDMGRSRSTERGVGSGMIKGEIGVWTGR